MEVRVNLPGLLRNAAGGSQRVMVQATTLEEAIATLLQQYPLLRVHLYDEKMVLRQHVLLYYNSDNIAWLDRLDVPLAPGDELHVLQAVSGG